MRGRHAGSAYLLTSPGFWEILASSRQRSATEKFRHPPHALERLIKAPSRWRAHGIEPAWTPPLPLKPKPTESAA